MTKRQRDQQRYARCVAERVCPRHTRRKAAPGRVYCLACLQRIRKRRAANIAAGGCANHPKIKPVPGTTLCAPCLDRFRAQHLRKKYGISLADYDALLRRQRGVCAVCRRPEVRVDRRIGRVTALVVDHDHVTERVRGLLCFACNTGIVHAFDHLKNVPRGFARLIRYVKEHA